MNSSTTPTASGTPAHAISPAQHDAIAAWFAGLQARIVAGLEGVDGGTFLHDAWQREPDSPTQGAASAA